MLLRTDATVLKVQGRGKSLSPLNNMPTFAKFISWLHTVLQSMNAGELIWRTEHTPKLLTATGDLQRSPIRWAGGLPPLRTNPNQAQPFGLPVRLQSISQSESKDFKVT